MPPRHPYKLVNIAVRLPEPVNAAIDEYARKHGLNKSEAVRLALEDVFAPYDTQSPNAKAARASRESLYLWLRASKDVLDELSPLFAEEVRKRLVARLSRQA